LTFTAPSCSFTATAPTEIYTLSLHDALPIYASLRRIMYPNDKDPVTNADTVWKGTPLSVANSYELWGSCRDTNMGAALREANNRSEEHTSELQSRENLVCRLLLEKKKNHTDS